MRSIISLCIFSEIILFLPLSFSCEKNACAFDVERDVISYIARPPTLTDLLSFFFKLREEGSGLLKKPSTDELLVWIIALKEISKNKENPMRNNADNLRRSLTALVKNSDDLKQAEALLTRWIREVGKK